MNEKDRESILEICNETYRLKCGLYLIGRNAENIEHHIPINDKSVDIKHAILEILQNETILTDLFSKNGTYFDNVALSKGEHYKLHHTSSAALSIKFGNVVGKFQFSSKEDSGYDGDQNGSLNEQNISDIIPPSPENISQTTSRSRLLGLATKLNSIHNGSNSLKTTATSKVPSSSPETVFSVLVPSTQANKSGEISRYSEMLDDDDDDFFIPETQEAFIEKKSNEKDLNTSKQNQENKSRLEKRLKLPQNRIFDNTESMIRICTQDFNVVDEKTTDSDDLLRDIVIPDDKDEITKEKDNVQKLFKENSKINLEDNKTKEKCNFAENNVEDGIDNDYDEEMSVLKWNESSNKSKSTLANNKSASVTPDLDIDNKAMESKTNERSRLKSTSTTPDLEIDGGDKSLASKNDKSNEPKSGSVTPDFDVIASILETEKQNSSRLSSITKSNQNVEETKVPSEIHGNEEDDDDFLSPTQPFIKENIAEISCKISPSNKENAPTNLILEENANQQQEKLSTSLNDNDSEATQVFTGRHKFNTVVGSNASKNDDDNFLKPAALTKIKPISTSKTILTNKPNDHENSNRKVNENENNIGDDDDDEMFELTQLFVRPAHFPVITSKNDINSKSSIATSTSTSLDNKSKLDDKPSLSSSASSATTTTLKISPTTTHEKLPSPSSTTTTTTTAEEEDSSVLSQFEFDICTPRWSNLKLPKKGEIQEAAKIFNELSKNQKHTKCIFEESSSSSSGDDDYDFDVDHKKNDNKKNQNVKSKVRTRQDGKAIKDEKVNREIKENREPIQTRSRRNEKLTKKEEKVKIEKTISKEIESKGCNVKLVRCTSRKISERSDDTKSKSDGSGQEKIKGRSTRSKTKTNKGDEKQQPSAPPPIAEKVEVRSLRRARRLVSNDKETTSVPSDKSSNHKRSSTDEINKEEIPSKRKRRSGSSPTFQVNLIKPKITFTKVDTEKYRNELKKIGAKVVSNPQECTILIAEQIFWTWKLMAAMAKGVPIVSPKWIEDAAKTPNNLPSIDDYIVEDKESEKKFKFNLKRSLSMAREKPIFEGYSFLITPKTQPPPEELIKIIECGNGRVLRKAPTQKLNNFYVISDKEDMIIWHRIRKTCPNVQIINTEGIMMAALQQRINFKNYLLS